MAASTPWQSLYDAEPGARAPAPGDLRLVQLFVNSVDKEGGVDGFGTLGGLRFWLVGNRLIHGGTRLSESDRSLAVTARESVRDLIAANTGTRVPVRSIDLLNRLGATGLSIRFERAGGARLAGADQGLHGALVTILAVIPPAIAAGTWARLKVCRRDRCRWVFYDRSRPGKGVWCTMAICGARTKSAAYYRRSLAQ